jgi:hypothetical protein
MGEDPLDTVLRLVHEGKLTADEAAPLLAALDATRERATSGSNAGAASVDPHATVGAGDGTGRSLRIEVIDAGRTVVNFRLPLALGRYAVDRVPGLSGDQADRVRAALRSGMTGPVLVVDDDGDGVRITIE